MTIWNIGSINADYFYQLPHLPSAGETLSSTSMTKGLGGKGANMSVAAARAGAHVRHIGCVGPDGEWAVERLMEYGVDTRLIATSKTPTAHAIVMVDPVGENSIVLFPGANNEITDSAVMSSLKDAKAGDTVLIQNETTAQVVAAKTARELGLFVAYAAAPFSADSAMSVLPYLSFLILNEVEAAQLKTATGQGPADLDVGIIIVTKGSKGCDLYNNSAGTVAKTPAIKVEPVDTTGAGDTFTGYVLAGLDRGLNIQQSIQLATRAGALMVTRLGTADVIPDLKEVEDMIFNQT